MKDIKNKLIVGLIMLVISQGLGIFGLSYWMKGKVENLEKNQQTILAAMMGQSELPQGPVRE